jgi:hypothetical protein
MAWDDEDDLDEDEYDDEDDDTFYVFVGMAFGREACDEAYSAIKRVCKKLDMNVLRAHPREIAGSHHGDDVVHALIDKADFAIIDLTHGRPSVAHEIGLVDRELGREFILLIGREGTERFSNIQGRVVQYYSDKAELERILKDQLDAMADGWNAIHGDDEEDDDE